MISEAEAAESLRDIERVRRRMGVASAYAHASPHLILWGVVWFLGYGATGLTRPEQWGLVWLPLIVGGAVGALVLGRRGASANRAGTDTGIAPGVRASLMAGAIALFMLCTYVVFQPLTPLPYLVFPALVVGLVYALVGSFGMPRFVWIGMGVLLMTMAGWLLARELIAFCVAAAGGGGLILGGLWLRHA